MVWWCGTAGGVVQLWVWYSCGCGTAVGVVQLGCGTAVVWYSW